MERPRILGASCWPTACARHSSRTGSVPHTGRNRAPGDADTTKRRSGAEGNMQVDQLANKCLLGTALACCRHFMISAWHLDWASIQRWPWSSRQ